MRHIAVLMARAANDEEGRQQAAALEHELAELGWLPGRNMTIDYRWQAGDVQRAREFARELATRNPDLFVAASTPSLVAAIEAAGTTPIVFVNVADPRGQGFVQSLKNPGGDVTGFALEEPSMGSVVDPSGNVLFAGTGSDVEVTDADGRTVSILPVRFEAGPRPRASCGWLAG